MQLSRASTLVATVCLICMLAASPPPALAGSRPRHDSAASAHRPATHAADAAVEASLLAAFRARSIGPAGMSGRVAAVDVVVSDPDTIYVGAATGGVWKSTDGGTTWKPIFDDQPVAAIGAVAVFQPSPEVVWIGTGEGNPRNSASVGNGVYRSLDGGRTWQHLGLEGTERIHRIVLHPTDPDIAYVAAMGQAWGENEERGVYRTTDGGATWERILYVNERTGAADLVMDPGNPRKLIAATWEYRRWPFFFESGGEGSGIWISYDGGDHWRRLTHEDGLPEGELGRIGLAIAPSSPNIVYALVEAERSALLRSEDGGNSWRTVNDEPDVSPRPFYFSDLRVDSEWPNRVYRVASRVTVSDDGGRTFRPLGRGFSTHPDHHAFWIHPHDATFIIDGNDGGISISRDRGQTWRFVRNLPLAQYYHVAVDSAVPYNVYGGLQDNGSWRGPSAVWEGGFFGGGIRNFHWQMVAFGDGFDTQPIDPQGTTGYAMSQGGGLVRWDLATGEARVVRPDGPDDEELRFNWNAGLAIDPFDRNVVYYGSQFVHRSADRGESWQIISPDLTTDEAEWQRQKQSGGLTPDVTAAENYTTIVAIAPSPVLRGVIWVGTDDGRLHVTRDGGTTWESVEDNVPGVPRNTWIPHIEASPHAAGTAFVVFDDHRRSNWTPYVYRTDDFGRTWRSLATDELWGYALKLVQDPVDPDLLFLGTEFGLWVSFDGGGHWMKWTHGVPTVSVMDMVIHPREHDLVIGTHGRALYLLDDIRPLRELPEALAEPLHLFAIPDAQQYSSFAARGELMPGSAEFVGENRPYGALISFTLGDEKLPIFDPDALPAAPRGPAAAFGGGGRRGAPRGPQVRIEVLDADGGRVRHWSTRAWRGFNRVVWNLRRDPFRRPPGGGGGFFAGRGGPEVPPGEYTVRVRYGDRRAEGTVRVLADPRSGLSDADRAAKWRAILAMGRLQELGADAVQRIVDARADVEAVLERARRGADGDGRRPAGGGRPGTAPGTETDGAQVVPPTMLLSGEQPPQGAPEQGPEGEQPSPLAALRRAGRELKDKLDETEKLFRVLPGTKGIVADDGALARVSEALGRLQGTWAAPSAADRAYMRRARAAVVAAVRATNELFAGPVEEFRRLTAGAGIELLPARPPLEIPEER